MTFFACVVNDSCDAIGSANTLRYDADTAFKAVSEEFPTLVSVSEILITTLITNRR